MPFSLGMEDRIAEYARITTSIVAQLARKYVHVIAVVTNHTDDNMGDLFLGLDGSGWVAGVADEVSAHFFAFFSFIDVAPRFSASSSRHSRNYSKALSCMSLPAAHWSEMKIPSSRCVTLFQSA